MTPFERSKIDPSIVYNCLRCGVRGVVSPTPLHESLWRHLAFSRQLTEQTEKKIAGWCRNCGPVLDHGPPHIEGSLDFRQVTRAILGQRLDQKGLLGNVLIPWLVILQSDKMAKPGSAVWGRAAIRASVDGREVFFPQSHWREDSVPDLKLTCVTIHSQDWEESWIHFTDAVGCEVMTAECRVISRAV